MADLGVLELRPRKRRAQSRLLRSELPVLLPSTHDPPLPPPSLPPFLFFSAGPRWVEISSSGPSWGQTSCTSDPSLGEFETTSLPFLPLSSLSFFRSSSLTSPSLSLVHDLAFSRNLMTALIEHGRITTTPARAKVVGPMMDDVRFLPSSLPPSPLPSPSLSLSTYTKASKNSPYSSLHPLS